MKLSRAKSSCSALTLAELLVVVVVIIFLYAFLVGFPEPNAKPKATAILCMNNQRQIALGFLLAQADETNQNHLAFPWQVSVTNQGTMELAERGDDAPNFDILLSYLTTPARFVCPTDPVKTVATNQSKLSNQNISYCIGLDAGTNPAAAILTGDRHLMAGQTPVHPGLFVYTNGAAMGWTRELHNRNSKTGLGVMSFRDGHAEVIADVRLNSYFKQTGLDTARFDIP